MLLSGAGGSGLACCTFLLNLKGPALLCCVGPFDDEMAPGARGSVRGECLLGLSADVKYFRETFRLSSNNSLSPPTALLPDRVLLCTVAALECDRLECARHGLPISPGPCT